MQTARFFTRHFARIVCCGMPFSRNSKSPKIKRKAEINTKNPSTAKIRRLSSATNVRSNEVGSEMAGITYLPELDKSENDKKLYRALQLQNGIKILLISDPVTNDCLEDADTVSRSSSVCGEESSCESGSEEEEENAEEEEEEEEHAEDEDEDGDYETENRKKSKGSGEKLAAASLTVKVGSFSDPKDLPGLAHFLEHMVFMGSENYPEENAFDAFIKKHGGNSNASTDCETTTFYFDIQHHHFLEALKIFAGFFASPLLRAESMQREKEAIDSEFQMALPSDSSRKQQLFGSLANPEHPMSKFMWGNSTSLQLPNDPEGKELNRRLREFWETHYSADQMTLVLQSKESLDDLEQSALEIFLHVPSRSRAIENPWLHYGDPFNNESFRKIYKIIPVKDINQLELNWSLPSQLKNYKIKPLNYMSWLIGHEGRGSLLAHLRDKVWAFNLSCGNEECGFEHNSAYAKFTVTIDLTEEGWNNKEEVIRAVFGYINMLKSIGPQERIYQEMQNVANMSFRYIEDTNPAEYAERLSENMQIYPIEHCITGDDLYFEFNDEVIRSCLMLLRADNMNVMLSSKKFAQLDICNETEQHFQTQYCREEIPKTLVDTWNSADFGDLFRIPDPNPFIATNFELLPEPEENAKYPQKISEESDGLVLYHRQDTIFKVPKACVFFYLTTPTATDSAKGIVLLDLLLSVLKQQLMTDIYDASVAQLDYALYPGDKGIVIKTAGFNHKLHVLVESIAKHVANSEESIQPDIFEAVKKETLKIYSNFALKPTKLVKDARMKLLLEKHWSVMDKLEALAGIGIDDLLDFSRKLMEDLYIEGLIQGNISKSDALSIARNLQRVLRTGARASRCSPVRVCQLPLGEAYCRLASFNREDANSVVVNYYQWGPTNIRFFAVMEVLVMLMEEPVFDILRTREQLGYDVSVMLRNTFGVLGFSITVNFQADKFSGSHIDERIEAFLSGFDKRVLVMSQSELDTTLNALIRLKQRPDVSLDEEVNRNWGEIVTEELLFDRIEREIECLHTVTIEEVRDVFRSLVASGNRKKFRKISMQVLGRHKELESENAKPMKFQYLVEPNSDNGKCFVQDIDDFKKTLHVHEPLKTYNGLLNEEQQTSKEAGSN